MEKLLCNSVIVLYTFTFAHVPFPQNFRTPQQSFRRPESSCVLHAVTNYTFVKKDRYEAKDKSIDDKLSRMEQV